MTEDLICNPCPSAVVIVLNLFVLLFFENLCKHFSKSNSGIYPILPHCTQ